MNIRCPHCHQPVELLDDAGLEEIDCPSCGSHFSLLGDRTASYHGEQARTLGHFELVDRLGVGQFGTVWMARDTQLDRTVAVKIPRREQLNREEAELFLREARAAAQLHHPNIVSVHEVGREGDTVYIVSDLVRGVTLADRLTAGRLSPREAAALCLTVAEALEHAHRCGVVHRDLKPSNIMLDADGRPHLMDFGLAKREAGEITMTIDGRVLGTPAYMSPEQAKGESHQADRRSDVYSLGTILFELLTGELPFRGNARMLLMQIIHDDAPAPRKLDASVPRDLETICLKCLEKSPERRYATAQAVADELRRWLSGQPIAARRVSGVERGWRWCRRNPVTAGLVACVGLLLAVLAVAGPLVAWQQSQLRQEESSARQDAETARNEALEARNDALEARNESAAHALQAYESVARAGYSQAHALRTARQGDRQRQAFAHLREAAAVRAKMKRLAVPNGNGAEDAAESQDLFWLDQLWRLNSEAAWWLTECSLERIAEYRIQHRSSFLDRAIAPNGLPPSAFNADGTLLARVLVSSNTSPKACQVEVVDLLAGTAQTQFELGSCCSKQPRTDESLHAVALVFSREAKELLIARADLLRDRTQVESSTELVRSIERHDVASGQLLSAILLDDAGEIATKISNLQRNFDSQRSLQLSEDGRSVLITGARAAAGAVQSWSAVCDSADGRLLRVFDDPQMRILGFNGCADQVLGLHQDGINFSIASVDVGSGRVVRIVPLAELVQDVGEVVRYLVAGPSGLEGRWLAIPRSTSSLALIELPALRHVIAAAPNGTVRSFLATIPCAVSADGGLVATVIEEQLIVKSLPDVQTLAARAIDDFPNVRDLAATRETTRVAFLGEGRIAVGRLDRRAREEVITVWDLSRPRTTGAQRLAAAGRAIRFGADGERAFWAADANASVEAKIVTQPLPFNGGGAILQSSNDMPQAPQGKPWRYVVSLGPPTKTNLAGQLSDDWAPTDFDAQSQFFVFPRAGGVDVIDTVTGLPRQSIDDAELIGASAGNRYLAVLRGKSTHSPHAAVFDAAENQWMPALERADWAPVSHPFEFSADGQYVWNVQGRGLCVARVADGATVYKNSLAACDRQKPMIDPRGEKIFFYGGDEQKGTGDSLRLVDLSNGEIISVLGLSPDNNMRAVFGPEGVWLAFIEPTDRLNPPINQQLKLWMSGRKEAVAIGAPTWSAFGNRMQLVGSQNRLVIAGQRYRQRSSQTDSVVEVWDVAEGKLLLSSKDRPGRYQRHHVDIDRCRLVANYSDTGTGRVRQRVEIHDLATGELIAEHAGSFEPPPIPAPYFLLSPLDGRMRVVDLATGQITASVPDMRPLARGVSPDAWSRVFFDSRGKTMLWNVRDKAGVFLPVKADHILGFSPDGKWLAAHEPSSAVGIQLWDVASKQLSRTISLDWPNHLPGAAESPVRSVRFSPDSQKLAVNVHGQIRLATIESGRLHTALERTGHAGRVRAIDVSPDGRLLATASDDQTVGLWNAADGGYAAMLDGFQTAPGNVAFFPDSQRLATVDLEGRLFVWRLNARSADDRLPLEANLFWKAPVDAKTSNGGTKALAVSADGALLAAQTTANAVTIYRAENGEVAHLVRVETPMNSLAFATDGRWLAGGGNDGVVRLWDPATGKSLAAWHSGQGVVNVVAAQTAGDLLVTAGRDIRLWQPVSRQLLLVLGEQRRPVNDLAFSRDGRLLATASDDQSLVWRFGDLGDELKRMGLGWTGLDAISPQPTNIPSEAAGEADSAIAADAPATDTSDGEATPNDGPPTIDALRSTMDLGGHAAPVTCLSFDSHGRRLVSGDQQGTVVVWDAANRSAGLVTSRHDKSVWAVAFAPGDRRIATASDDATIRICDATNGLNETIIQTPCGIHALAYQPGGKLLAAAGADGTAYLFDAATGEKTAALAASEKALWSVAFSPDGKRLATAGVDSVIKIWDVGNSAAVSSLQGHTAVVWSVAFHPDGNRLASASDDWSVRIWDVASAQELRKLTGHTISPYSVAFSRDGQFMASAAGHRWQPRHNGEVIVWDTASWQNHTYPGTACGFFAAAFRPDRPQLAAAGTDRSIHVWDLPAAWAAEDTPAGVGAEVLAGGSSAAWSPDGTQVFYSAGGDDGIHRIDLPTRSVAQLIAPGHDPAVSPLGKQLAYARNTDARQEEVWLAEVDGSNRRKLADGGFPRWAADGQTLYFHSRSDGKVKAIDVTAADSTDVVECRESFYPAVSPDGKRLAYVAGGNLTVVHLGTNDRLVRSLPGAGSGLVGWSPDGKQLAYGGYGVNDRVGLWLLDVGTGNAKQLFAGQYTMPAWSPDGKRLAFDLRAANRSLILAIETEKLKPPE